MPVRQRAGRPTAGVTGRVGLTAVAVLVSLVVLGTLLRVGWMAAMAAYAVGTAMLTLVLLLSRRP